MSTEQLFEHARQGSLIKLGQLAGGGADLSVKDADGMTALMHACAAGGHRIVKMLLKTGADSSLTDNNGKTAQSYAEASGNAKSLKHLSRLG